MTRQEAREKAIMDIKRIIEIVEDTWLANDGGLTWAATDVLATARNLIELIKENDIKSILKYDPTSADTGTECDLICIAQEWAIAETYQEA